MGGFFAWAGDRAADLLAHHADDSAPPRRYGDIRAQLERCGTPIGANDLWIAAQGSALDVIVVTDNQAEFNRIPGLRTENWLDRS